MHSKYSQVEIKPHWFSHRTKQFHITFHFHSEIISQSQSIENFANISFQLLIKAYLLEEVLLACMWGNTKCICKREKNNAHVQKLRLHNFDPCAPVDFFAPPSPSGQLQIIQHSPLLPLVLSFPNFFSNNGWAWE